MGQDLTKLTLFNPLPMKRAQDEGLPGISFATVESAYVLPNLLCWFDWKLPDDARCKDLDMSDVFVLVLRKKIPLRLVPVMPA
ncbi:hypothetical protein WN943_013466 [Citrus x changshan-huyou]